LVFGIDLSCGDTQPPIQTLTDGGHLRCDWPCPEGKGQTFESRAFAQQWQAIEALEVDKLLEGQMKTSPTARWRGSDTPLAFCEP
jgi:hypothetical protein